MNCPECDAILNIPEGSNVELKQAETVGEDWGE
jgi:hypothetical protein